MANLSILSIAALVVTSLVGVPGVPAQSRLVYKADICSGICTNHLTPKQLRIWKKIEKIVLASDKAGKPLHPTLHNLWQRIQSSGGVVLIEMTEHRTSTLAGTTRLQERKPEGSRKVVVVWLNLWVIDNAFVSPVVRRGDGLIPFYKLDKYERYAEVLGHELTHAALMLECPEYARLCLAYGSAAEKLLVTRKRDSTLSEEHLLHLQSLADIIEKPAQAAELEIWRELRHGQRR